MQCRRTKSKPGDGLDNDCDGKFDEEILDGKDNDGDGRIDEDLQLVMPLDRYVLVVEEMTQELLCGHVRS